MAAMEMAGGSGAAGGNPSGSPEKRKMKVDENDRVIKAKQPVVLATVYKYKQADEHNPDAIPWCNEIVVRNAVRCYQQVKSIKVPAYPFDEEWKFNRDTKDWTQPGKTEKQVRTIKDILRAVVPADIEILDERLPWKDTFARINIQRFFDSDENVEHLQMSGETYYIRDEIKNAGGRWSSDERAWVNISINDAPTIIRKIEFFGFDIRGMFNHDGRFAILLAACNYSSAKAPPGVHLTEREDYFRIRL